MISRPAAFNSVGRAVIAMVGEGLTRARRSARKDMTGRTQTGKTRHRNVRRASCEAVPRLYPALTCPAIYRSTEAAVRKVGSSPSIDAFADIARAFGYPIYH